jgi:hypothetical protein
MRKHTLRLSVVLAIAAGILHFSGPQAKAIELLVRVAENIGRATALAERHTESVSDFFEAPLEDAYEEGDADELFRLLEQAGWELNVLVRRHESQVANMGKGAVDEIAIEPVRESSRLVVRAYADDVWIDLIEAAGGVDIVLDPDDHPGNSPRW